LILFRIELNSLKILFLYQFHQHFTSSFFDSFLLPKKCKLNRKKHQITILYNKAARKMLMKLIDSLWLLFLWNFVSIEFLFFRSQSTFFTLMSFLNRIISDSNDFFLSQFLRIWKGWSDIKISLSWQKKNSFSRYQWNSDSQPDSIRGTFK